MITIHIDDTTPPGPGGMEHVSVCVDNVETQIIPLVLTFDPNTGAVAYYMKHSTDAILKHGLISMLKAIVDSEIIVAVQERSTLKFPSPQLAAKYGKKIH